MINLFEICAPSCRGAGIPLFEDDYFSRHKISLKPDPLIDMNITVDCIDSLGVECLYISLDSQQDRRIEFVFADAQIVSHPQGKLITDNEQGRLFWIPTSPALREYDDHGRMVTNVESAFEIIPQSSGFRLAAMCKAGLKLEFVILLFRERIESFSKELTELAPVETKHVVRDTWLRYEGVSSVWDYLINGMIFSTKHIPARKAWNSQNLAYGLYHYLDFLLKGTEKQIYLICRDLVAYSVMLSLPDDSRWRHGIWTDLMETHMVHQAAGIHTLLSFYEDTGNKLFLQKSRAAADYLISCVDKLDDGKVWFLHDSLEENPEDVRLYYKNLIPSNAFGKSPSNTLCLNTHISTLTILHRINELAPDDRYKKAFDEGLASLKRVLGETPCTIIYGIVYGFRDCLLKLVLKTNSRVIRKIQWRYDHALRKSILPRLKKKFPRFVMPNGYIERDLCFAPLSDFYHMLNLKELLILYDRNPCDWLAGILEKSVPDTVKSGLVDYVAIYGSRVAIFLEVLLMYAAMIDDDYLSVLVRYFMRLKDLDQTIQTDLLSNPLIADPSLSLTADDSRIIILAPAKSTKFVAVIINIADNDIVTTLAADKPGKLEIVDCRDGRFSLRQRLTIPAGGYLKVVRING